MAVKCGLRRDDILNPAKPGAAGREKGCDSLPRRSNGPRSGPRVAAYSTSVAWASSGLDVPAALSISTSVLPLNSILSAMIMASELSSSEPPEKWTVWFGNRAHCRDPFRRRQ